MSQIGLFLIIIFCARKHARVRMCVCVRACVCLISADKVYSEKESRQITYLEPVIKSELTTARALLSLSGNCRQTSGEHRKLM